MSARLITKRTDGSVIIDSSQVTVGLVKSGYMSFLTTLQRWRRQNRNNQNMVPYNAFDNVHGFTVRAVSPMVFVSGRAVLVGSSRSGEYVTYYYAHASTSTRYYVYDTMSYRGTGPKLVLRDTTGKVTFDSDMLPLKVAGTYTPPGPSNIYGIYLGWENAYSGGFKTTEGAGGNFTTAFNYFTVFIGAGDYAVNLPWSRGASHTIAESNTGSFGCTEGAYGSGNNITFVFATDAGASFNSFFNFPLGGASPQFFLVPFDRIPTVTYINTTGLPFPFDADL